MKILIIEDSFTCIKVQSLVIQAGNSLCFDITSVTTLLEGLNKCKEVAPDMVLLDLCLPDSSTENTIDFIPEIKKYTKLVVVVSGWDNQDIITKVLAQGADKFITKKDFSMSNKENIQFVINQLLN